MCPEQNGTDWPQPVQGDCLLPLCRDSFQRVLAGGAKEMLIIWAFVYSFHCLDIGNAYVFHVYIVFIV